MDNRMDDAGPAHQDNQFIENQNCLRFAKGFPVQTVHHLEQLGFPDDRETDAVIWARRLPSSVRAALSSLPTHDVENGRYSVPVDEAAACLHHRLHEWSFDAGEAGRWLAADVAALAGRMAKTLSISHLSLRIELVRDDACRKFHRDTVKARLICTYSGPGTELGIADRDDQPDEIQTVPTGCPILLKGKLWPDNAQRLLFHRSPPIEHIGASRLVIALDEAPANSH